MTLAKGSQTRIGVGHISAMIDVLKTFKFEEMRGNVRLVQEPVGVCALITPWNWPMNQVAAKVVPALAAGCTMVLKPSEYSPFSAILWAKVMHEAGVPAGVFNLINGDGPMWARRCPRIAKSTWCPSPARPGPAPKWRRAPPRRSSACIRSSAASRRTCCWMTPISSAP
jgi:acyl-CoA reductase-like NAD-dependent aldehyde dehydrogenase